jgi:hypothetical protein
MSSSWAISSSSACQSANRRSHSVAIDALSVMFERFNNTTAGENLIVAGGPATGVAIGQAVPPHTTPHRHPGLDTEQRRFDHVVIGSPEYSLLLPPAPLRPWSRWRLGCHHLGDGVGNGRHKALRCLHARRLVFGETAGVDGK